MTHENHKGSHAAVMPRRGSVRSDEGRRWGPGGDSLVHEDAVVVLTTSVTATARVLAVLPHATVTGRNVTALLAVLLKVCGDQGSETKEVRELRKDVKTQGQEKSTQLAQGVLFSQPQAVSDYSLYTNEFHVL
jgi:hypothetical protein